MRVGRAVVQTSEQPSPSQERTLAVKTSAIIASIEKRHAQALQDQEKRIRRGNKRVDAWVEPNIERIELCFVFPSLCFSEGVVVVVVVAVLLFALFAFQHSFGQFLGLSTERNST